LRGSHQPAVIPLLDIDPRSRELLYHTIPECVRVSLRLVKLGLRRNACIWVSAAAAVFAAAAAAFVAADM
jgi:hypothetical protein